MELFYVLGQRDAEELRDEGPFWSAVDLPKREVRLALTLAGPCPTGLI